MHDVAVLDDIFLTFDSHFSGSSYGRFGLVVHVIVIFDDFCADETLLEVAVDNTCGLRSLVSPVYGPGPAFVGTGGEESLESV